MTSGEGPPAKYPVIERFFRGNDISRSLVLLAPHWRSMCVRGGRDFSNCLYYRSRYMSSFYGHPALRNLR